jgi:nucleoside-diphosphate-sugar epimerase
MGTLPELTKEMATTTTMVYTYSNEKIRKALGFEFRLIEQSIKDFSEFFLKDHQ